MLCLAALSWTTQYRIYWKGTKDAEPTSITRFGTRDKAVQIDRVVSDIICDGAKQNQLAVCTNLELKLL